MSIDRKPIKFRSPIQLEYCTCWGTKVISYNSKPFLTLTDGVGITQLKEYIQQVPFSTAMYVIYDENQGWEKIKLCLSKNLPVYVKTYEVLPQEVVDLLRESQHSAVSLEIADFLEQDIPKARKMLQELKSWGVSTVLEVSYIAYNSLLDTLVSIEKFKNVVGHVTVHLPNVEDEEVLSYQQNLMNMYYNPCVETRSWVMKEDYKKVVNGKVSSYLETRKIRFEEGISVDSEDRVRHVSSVGSASPFGLPEFIYKNTGEGFEEYINPYRDSEEVTLGNCPRCGKLL
ncbi:hypothetical protein [Bacillus phage SPO1L1]|nr:hypothetical protein [Bacillus phage SPO1L1]WIT26062.1 hypothetical protein [Bacillus phage SPO1L2]